MANISLKNGLNVDWFKLFVVTNALMVGCILWWIQYKWDLSSQNPEELLGGKNVAVTSSAFGRKAALKDVGSYFVQLEHPSSNSKVEILLLDSPNSIDDLESTFAKLSSGEQANIPIKAEKFIKSHFNPRRAEKLGLINFRNNKFLHLKVKDKEYYLLGKIKIESLNRTGIMVALNRENPLDTKIIEDLFLEYNQIT